MNRGILIGIAAMCALAWATPCLADWMFWTVDTVNPDPRFGWPCDGRIYMPDGVTLVPEGCFVQFVLDTAGDGVDDPLAFFDADKSGRIDTQAEAAALQTWVNAGADPSAFSDDQLLTASGWNGTSVIGADWRSWITGPGEVLINPADPFSITNGDTGQVFGWRAWSLTPGQLVGWTGSLGESLWYTTGPELGTYEYAGIPYDGWWIGAPDGVPPEAWVFFGTVGFEVYMHYETGDPMYRSENRLDHDLTPIPEPGTLALVGVGLAPLVWRWRRK